MKSLGIWLAEAVTVFANGALSGLVVGGIVGGAASSQASDIRSKIIAALATLALAAASNGVKRVLVWHDANPIPNPFAPATNPPPAT